MAEHHINTDLNRKNYLMIFGISLKQMKEGQETVSILVLQKLISDKKVLIIGLDTRYFRSDLIKRGDSYQANTAPTLQF